MPSRSRSSDGSWRAADGISESTVLSTSERFSNDASQGIAAAEVNGSATSHATTNTAAPCSTEPSTLSRPVSLREVIRSRSSRPTHMPRVSPRATSSTTTPTPTPSRAGALSTRSSSAGASFRPTTAPTNTPQYANGAVTRPLRAPDTAATSPTSTTSRSTQFTVHRSADRRPTRQPQTSSMLAETDVLCFPHGSPSVLQVPHVLLVPVPGPAAQFEQAGQQPSGEAPHQHARNQERRARVPAADADPQPVVRVGQPGDRHPGHRRGFRRVHRGHRGRPPPVRDHRRHPETAVRHPQLGQGSQRADPVALHPHFFLRFAQGGLDRPVVGGVQRAA